MGPWEEGRQCGGARVAWCDLCRLPQKSLYYTSRWLVVLSLCSVLLSRNDLNSAPSRTQDSGWLLVLLALRAFGMWGVVCVVQQLQNRRPARERACGAAGATSVCLNPGAAGATIVCINTWGGEGTTCHRQGKGKVMGSPLRLDISCKHVSNLLLLLALLSSAHAASPWSVKFGGCVFSGDRDGAALERSVYCQTVSGILDLSYKGITSVKNDSFAGMGALT